MCNDLGLQRLKEYIDEDDVIYIQAVEIWGRFGEPARITFGGF